MSYVGTTDFLAEVRKGNVPRHSIISKHGENPILNTADGFRPVWDNGAVYAAPTDGRIHDIVSNSALDVGTTLSSGIATGGSASTLIDTGAAFITDGVTANDLLLNDKNISIGIISGIPSETELNILFLMRNPNDGFTTTDNQSIVNQSGDDYRVVTNGSTGASIMHIKGLNSFFLEQQEFVVLNGLTNVPTLKSWRRQFRCRMFGKATIGAVGTVTSTAQVDLTITSQVINGNNQTLMAIYTVPLNCNAYLIDWDTSLSKKQAATSVVRLRAGQINAITYIVKNKSISSTGSSEFQEDLYFLPVTGGADIFVEADTNANGTGISAGFDILLVRNA